MKKKPINSLFSVLVALASLPLIFSSCLKDDDVEFPDAAVVTFIHGSPKTPRLDIKLDENRLNIADLSYTKYWNNQNAYIGNRTLSVYRRGESTAILTKAISLEKDKHYSVFLVDSASKIDAVLLQNSSRPAAQDSVRIKFANMSPDVPKMDFYIKGQSTPFATNVSYKEAADFVSVKAGYDQIIEVKEAGQSVVLAASLPMNLTHRNIYTVWTSGFRGIPSGEGQIVISNVKHTGSYYWY